jgi:hypothetical protein
LKKLFNQYRLKNKIIVYVKDEGSNLNTLTIASKSVGKCEVLRLNESFQGACFGHVFSKYVNMLLLMKSLQEFQICFNQIYPVIFAKMYNLTLKI